MDRSAGDRETVELCPIVIPTDLESISQFVCRADGGRGSAAESLLFNPALKLLTTNKKRLHFHEDCEEAQPKLGTHSSSANVAVNSCSCTETQLS